MAGAGHLQPQVGRKHPEPDPRGPGQFPRRAAGTGGIAPHPHELRDPATASGAIARCRRQDLDTDEIREHLRTGKQVFQLGLLFDDRISFVLGEDLILRKIKFTDVVLDEQADSPESAAAEMDANFALMALEYERLLGKLEEWFKLPRPE